MTQTSTHDRKSIRSAEKAQRLADARREGVIKMLMSTPDGREWTFNLLGRCHLFSTTFDRDHGVAAFAEGERNIGLMLLADILLVCPDQYLQAQRESNDRHNSDDRSPAAERSDDADGSGRHQGREGAITVDEDGRFYEVGGDNDPNNDREEARYDLSRG